MPDGARYEFEDDGQGGYSAPAGRYDTLVRNADGSFDFWLQRSSASYHFTPAGSLETKTDEFGNQLFFNYDANGRLLRIDDLSGSGRYLDIYWGADGRISNVVDSAGRQIGYTYNTAGMLTGVTDVLGRTTSYEYVAGKYNPVLSSITDHWGRVVSTVVFDPQDRVASYSDQGETYSYTYNYSNDPSRTAKQDSSGNTWIYTHTEGGLVTRDQGPGGVIRDTDYYADGSIMMVTDELGVKTFYTYDTEGRILSVTLDHQGPTAVRFDYDYDPSLPNHVTAITPRDPTTGELNSDWQGWQYDYYPAGSLAPGARHHVYRVRNDGFTIDTLATFEYDAQGRITAVTNAAGGRAEIVYDAQGNLTTIRAPSNNTGGTRPETQFGYDGSGQVVSVTDPLNQVATLTRDAAGRMLTWTLPPPEPGSTIDFTVTATYDQYDPISDLLFVQLTDSNDRTVEAGYDQHGQLVEVHDTAGGVTRFDYSNGLLASITDAKGEATSFVYDSLHRLEQVVFPDSTFEAYSYHADGLLSSRTDAEGRTVQYSYDDLKRLSGKVYPDGTNLSYTYDGQKLVEVFDSTTNPYEVHAFTYDDANRVVSYTQGDRGTIDYSYTTAGRLASMSVLGGPTTTYSYYPDGSLHTTQWSPIPGDFEYTYNLRGQLDTVTFPNGQQLVQSYDDQGRLVEMADTHPSAGEVAKYAYGYDLDHFTGQPTMSGKLTSIVADVPAEGVIDALAQYYFDDAYQLVRVDYPEAEPFLGEVHEWAHDSVGNRLTEQQPSGTVAATYGDQNRMLTYGATSYTWNDDGDLVTRTSPTAIETFDYDVFGNLIAYWSPSIQIDYLVDAANRRVGRKVNGNLSQQFLYADQLNPIAELDGSGSIVSSFVYGTRLNVPDFVVKDGVPYRLISDHLGSVRLVVNAADGSTVQRLDYDAWGKVVYDSNPGFQPFGYAGGIYDPDTGLTRFGVRDYEPHTGRWIAKDPTMFLGGDGNLYRYALGDPVRYVDPHGESGVLAIGAGAAIADGPLPFGDVIFAGTAVWALGEFVWDHLHDDTPEWGAPPFPAPVPALGPIPSVRPRDPPVPPGKGCPRPDEKRAPGPKDRPVDEPHWPDPWDAPDLSKGSREKKDFWDKVGDAVEDLGDLLGDLF